MAKMSLSSLTDEFSSSSIKSPATVNRFRRPKGVEDGEDDQSGAEEEEEEEESTSPEAERDKEDGYMLFVKAAW
jgi:hypothetical protein